MAILALASVSSSPRSGMPAIPELPESGWPAPAVAERFASDLIAAVSAESLAATLREQPQIVPSVLRNTGQALMTDNAPLRASLERYLRDVVTAEAQHIGTGFSADELQLLAAILLVDPYRFGNDSAFRNRVLPALPRALDDRTPLALRRAVLGQINEMVSIDFETSERIGAAWNAVTRRSEPRRIAFTAGVTMPDDLAGPIAVSLFSLSSHYCTPAEAQTFVAAVHAAAPNRRIVVLADDTIARVLSGSKIDTVPVFSRSFTPWLRDPFIVGRSAEGAVVLVNRPNAQPEREEDANMVRALVQGLPRQLDSEWKTRWTVAPVPFHNGHILLTPAAAWISIHTVEIRALELLGISRVPVETFDTEAGVKRYLDAVRRAADELASLYRKPVHFVHPLDPSPALMRRLGGGGGFDLDSIVTLLPQTGGTVQALVGDVASGAKLARSTSTADWSRIRSSYGFVPSAEELGASIAAAQSDGQAAGLQTFLDTVAESLSMRGIRVRRLPLLVIPAHMVENGSERSFLLTWNNVVLEKEGARRHAEGFSSLLPSGDAIARKEFAEAGYDLTLFPPLVRSVLLSGGYRCASNHVRP